MRRYVHTVRQVGPSVFILTPEGFTMTARLGNWMIAIGAVTVFLALCCLPAALGDRSDPTLLAVSASIFSLGALGIATGIYVKAGLLRSLGIVEAEAAPVRRARGGCELCGSDVPVIQCRVHQLQLCATCLAEHYDSRSCSFVPPPQRPASKSGKGMARARGA